VGFSGIGVSSPFRLTFPEFKGLQPAPVIELEGLKDYIKYLQRSRRYSYIKPKFDKKR
jgi:hypothetical protein